MSEEELAKMWSRMGLGEGVDPGSLPGANLLPDIMPLVTNMMQNLLSKDILYPALTDLSNKVSSPCRLFLTNNSPNTHQTFTVPGMVG